MKHHCFKKIPSKEIKIDQQIHDLQTNFLSKKILHPQFLTTQKQNSGLINVSNIRKVGNPLGKREGADRSPAHWMREYEFSS